MPKHDALETLRWKRNPGRTSDPMDEMSGKHIGEPTFVIQEHDATSLHFDFRLEADGVLKSWAVPKGPSINPKEKRLAMPTEDHPLGYARFEGVIREGEYGAGPVIVWDTGTYRNLSQSDGDEVPVREAIEEGHVSFWLDGEKLTGGFSLTRVAEGRRPRWILVKQKDEGADARRNLVTSEPASVLSGKTIEEMAEEADG